MPMVFCVFQSAFQPTPPVWGATCGSGVSLGPLLISTHAPRVGGDVRFGGITRPATDFNPRPPCGGRL